MSRRFAGSVATGVLVVGSAVMVSPADAAVVEVIGVNGGTACEAVFGGSGRCFTVGGKLTATLVGSDQIVATNPVTAYVGDTISLTNQSGVHNIAFCKPGTVIPNNFNFGENRDWTCGDPMSPSGDYPGTDISASGPGAPQMIGYPWEGKTFPYSTTLTEAGEFYFWCGVGDHKLSGQYGKLIVKPAVSTTSTSPTSAPAPSTTSGDGSPSTTTASSPTSGSRTVSAPTLSLKKSRGRITATGRATPGARVTLQRRSGTKWVSVARTTASSSGAYVVSAKSEPKVATYRVLVGSRSSASTRI